MICWRHYHKVQVNSTASTACECVVAHVDSMMLFRIRIEKTGIDSHAQNKYERLSQTNGVISIYVPGPGYLDG